MVAAIPGAVLTKMKLHLLSLALLCLAIQGGGCLGLISAADGTQGAGDANAEVIHPGLVTAKFVDGLTDGLLSFLSPLFHFVYIYICEVVRKVRENFIADCNLAGVWDCSIISVGVYDEQ